MKTLHKIHILAIAIFSILAQSCTNLDLDSTNKCNSI